LCVCECVAAAVCDADSTPALPLCVGDRVCVGALVLDAVAVCVRVLECDAVAVCVRVRVCVAVAVLERVCVAVAVCVFVCLRDEHERREDRVSAKQRVSSELRGRNP
jgi:hypothetical protein